MLVEDDTCEVKYSRQQWIDYKLHTNARNITQRRGEITEDNSHARQYRLLFISLAIQIFILSPVSIGNNRSKSMQSCHLKNVQKTILTRVSLNFYFHCFCAITFSVGDVYLSSPVIQILQLRIRMRKLRILSKNQKQWNELAFRPTWERSRPTRWPLHCCRGWDMLGSRASSNSLHSIKIS